MSAARICRSFSPTKTSPYIQTITVPKADQDDQTLSKPQTSMHVLITVQEKPEEAEKDSSTPKIESYSLFSTMPEKDPSPIDNTLLKKARESRVLSNIRNIIPTPSSITREKNIHNQKFEYFITETVKSVNAPSMKRSRSDTF